MPNSKVAPEQVSVLLVDDRPENLISLKAVLDDPSYRLVTAASGEEALRAILHEEFALILLDVQMPGIDGFETARLIKLRSRSKNIPIIFVTALSKEEPFIYKGYSAGAVDYVFKPFDPQVLRSKVSVFAELHRMRLQIEIASEKSLRQERFELDKEAAMRELKSLRREQEANQRYRDLLEGIQEGVVWVVDAKTFTPLFVSPQVFNLIGLSESEFLTGLAILDGMPDEDRKNTLHALKRVVETGADQVFEHRFIKADQSVCWFRVSLRLAESAGRKEIRGLSIDITKVKDAEEALKFAVRLRDDFLSIASHELKTPLTPLRLQLQLLQRNFTAVLRNFEKESASQLGETASAGAMAAGPVGNFGGGLVSNLGNGLGPDTISRYNRSIESSVRQVDRLAKLVDELLDVSRINAGQMILERESFELADVVHENVARFAMDCKKSACEVVLDLESGITGNWDRMRIEQVFVNVFTNAMKYGRGKPIEVFLYRRGSDAILRIKDGGIGISEKDRERIFNRFERAVSPSDFGGLGLGLFIVSQILLAHGGKIEVESSPGEGSEFTVVLPLEQNSLSQLSPSNHPREISGELNIL